jgi:hypothetical protein
MKDPVNLMLSARNKYVLVACNRSFPNLESILTDNDKNLIYREIYNTKSDVLKASKSACFDDCGVGCYYITTMGDVCNVDGLILYKRYKTHYIERSYYSSSSIYNNKGNYIGVHYHKLFVFNEGHTGRKGFQFVKNKAYPIFEYAEFTNEKPKILHTEKVKSIVIQDLSGYNIILDGFLSVNDFDYSADTIGSTFNPNTKKGYIVNTLTHALGGIK